MTEQPNTSTLLSRIKSRLQAVYGDRLRGVVMYGSEARGEATPDSDVDILVLLTGPVALGRELYKIIPALYPLQLEMSRVLEAFPVDEADYLREEMPGIAMRRKRASGYEPGHPRAMERGREVCLLLAGPLAPDRGGRVEGCTYR